MAAKKQDWCGADARAVPFVVAGRRTNSRSGPVIPSGVHPSIAKHRPLTAIFTEYLSRRRNPLQQHDLCCLRWSPHIAPRADIGGVALTEIHEPTPLSC